MESNQDRAGVGPGVVDVVAGVEGKKTEYQTGKGCLMFLLLGLVLVGITVAVIVLASDPATVVG